MKWKAGDLALVVVRSEHDYAHLSGKIVRLVRYVGTTWRKGIHIKDTWQVSIEGRSPFVSEGLLQKPPEGRHTGIPESIRRIFEQPEKEKCGISQS